MLSHQFFKYLSRTFRRNNLAKNGLNQKAFIKERGTELFKDCQQRKEIHCAVGMSEFLAPLPLATGTELVFVNLLKIPGIDYHG
jgi:hypothetical protein